ncbi:hypothetical protein HAZT_HAZT008988, partial [Hyalella azteca]
MTLFSRRWLELAMTAVEDQLRPHTIITNHIFFTTILTSTTTLPAPPQAPLPKPLCLQREEAHRHLLLPSTTTHSSHTITPHTEHPHHKDLPSTTLGTFIPNSSSSSSITYSRAAAAAAAAGVLHHIIQLPLLHRPLPLLYQLPHHITIFCILITLLTSHPLLVSAALAPFLAISVYAQIMCTGIHSNSWFTGGPSCSSSSGGLTSAPGHSSSVGDARNSPTMHAPPYPPNGPPHAPPPHGYPSKMGGHMSPAGLPYPQPGAYQQPGGLQYPGARPQGSSMHPFPQNFPPGGPQPPQGPPSSIPPSHQYPPRPPHSNHGPPSQYSPYPHYSAQQAWGPSMGQGPPPSSVLGSPGLGGKNQHPGQPVQPGGGAAGLPRPHTPPHYLKQHLHQKMGVYGPPPGAPPSAGGPPQMYPNGPGLPPGLGGGVRESSPGVGMVGAPAPHGGQNNAMPPPTSTPGPNEMELSNASAPSNLSSGNNALSQQQPPPPIGPDGNPLLDDASQQSTLSNTSAGELCLLLTSGDDRSLTPKPHKDGPVPSNMTSMMSGGNMMGPGGPMGVQSSMTYGSSSHGGPPMNSSHPLNPHSHHQSSAPSPGSQPPEQGEYEGNVNSPGWPRSPSTQQAPSSAYGNSSTPAAPDIYRPSKADNIARLYEMSDSPERRQWLDKLLQFMEENKTPIAACPTISKNPLDLYALYLHVKERGGFMEVTKNKQWKDVAAVMGIGASSSGSYTLRKHYMKHILSYECRFDRGGIDPQPIISQIEASAKKKSSKPVSVPSPGSSNSQDSFPPAGSNNSSMDGYSNGPPHPGMPPYTPYPPSSDYPGHMQQRPPSQSQP